MTRFLVLPLAVLLAGCPGMQLVPPYDATIEKGIVEFYEEFNNFIKDLGDAAGKPEGVYEANTKRYNALDSKIDVLILRASAASEGKGCKLESRIYQKVANILQDAVPAQLRPESQTSDGDPSGCNSKLLELVKGQLNDIRTIHSTTDKCDGPGRTQMSCLRKATSVTALKIANQSITAVSVVEAAKKN